MKCQNNYALDIGWTEGISCARASVDGCLRGQVKAGATAAVIAGTPYLDSKLSLIGFAQR
jgi:hypothetical protein